MADKSQFQYQAKTEAWNPETEIIQGLESRWHYPWSEPVRQKPGLKAHLQQAFIATTLEPNTQIIQGFESRWHYPWSEPVRLRRFPTAEQQVAPAVFRPPLVSFAYYNWLTEPVRLKPGLRVYLQQAAIEPVLNPGTQIIQGFESRWHYAWSEPVRTKPGLLAALQVFAEEGLVPHAPPVFGTLIVTEQGDLFFASGTFFTQVGSALVGLVEIVPQSALAGVIEIPRFPANVEAATAPIYSVNVSIRTS